MQVQRFKIFLLALSIWTVAINPSFGGGVEPSNAKAFQSLYKLEVEKTAYVIDETHFAEVWSRHHFHDGVHEYLSVFVQVQNLDEQKQLINCHGCTASIDVITYKNSHDDWAHLSTQKNITHLGSFGRVGEVSSPFMLSLSKGNSLLLIPEHGFGQGTSSSGLSLLNFYKGNWRDVGYLETSGDNLGDCGPELLSERSCYSYSSELSIATNRRNGFPDLFLKRYGRTYQGSSNSVTYRFNGETYVAN
jgi:hypothetical protein